MKIQLLIKTQNAEKSRISDSDVECILLTNVKMPTIVGILTFMSGINFMISPVEYEKCFLTSRLYNRPSKVIKLDKFRISTKQRIKYLARGHNTAN